MGARCCRASNAVVPMPENGFVEKTWSHSNKVQTRGRTASAHVAKHARAIARAAAAASAKRTRGISSAKQQHQSAWAVEDESLSLNRATMGQKAGQLADHLVGTRQVRGETNHLCTSNFRTEPTAAAAAASASADDDVFLPGEVQYSQNLVPESDQSPRETGEEPRDAVSPASVAAAQAIIVNSTTMRDVGSTRGAATPVSKKNRAPTPTTPTAPRIAALPSSGSSGDTARSETQDRHAIKDSLQLYSSQTDGPTSIARTSPYIRRMHQRLHFVPSPFEGNRHAVSPKIRQMQVHLGFIRPPRLHDPFRTMWPAPSNPNNYSSLPEGWEGLWETSITACAAATTQARTPPKQMILLESQHSAAASTATSMSQPNSLLMQLAIYRFNQSPKRGIQDLLHCGCVADDPQVIVRFLCEDRRISRLKLGEFLGSSDERGKACLNAHAETLNFTNMAIDVSLRLFLRAFHIPGEAQKIERVMAAFANRYHACNPSCFRHEDTAFILAFSVMILHTDLHNPSNRHKMTLQSFVRNNRGIDDGADVPRDLLEEIYHRIQAEEFQCCEDHTSKVETLEQRLGGHVPAGIVTETRQFVRTADVDELYRSKKNKTKGAAVKRVVTLLIFNDLVLVASQVRAGRRYNVRKVFDLFTSELQRESEQHEGMEAFVLRTKDSDSSIRLHTEDPSVITTMRSSLQLCRNISTFTWADSTC